MTIIKGGTTMIEQIRSLFALHTANTTYCFRVTDEGFLQHLHYGRRIDLSHGFDALIPQTRHLPGNTASLNGVGLEVMQAEFSAPGLGDVRENFVTVRTANGDTLTDFRFESAEILGTKPALPGLPSAYDESGTAQALRVALMDKKNAPIYGNYAGRLVSCFSENER